MLSLENIELMVNELIEKGCVNDSGKTEVMKSILNTYDIGKKDGMQEMFDTIKNKMNGIKRYEI